MSETKICSKCKNEKDIGEFRYRKDKGRYEAMCKSCRSEENRKWRENNHEVWLNNAKQYYLDNKEKVLQQAKVRQQENPEKKRNYNILTRITRTSHVLWLEARTRARRKNIPFDITENDVIVPDVCPVLGIPIKVNSGNNVKHGIATSPSLDRIDNTKGYVKGNVRVISWRANNLKGTGTLEEFMKLIEYLKNPNKDAP